MITTRVSSEKSRLAALLGDTARSVGEGRLRAALRTADSACRIAPDDATCLLVHAKLLTQTGSALEALDRLRGRDEPELLLAHAEALLALGHYGDAAEICRMLLSRHALDSIENLQAVASRVCLADTETKLPGWVGVDSGLRVVGHVLSGHQIEFAIGNSNWYPNRDSDAGDPDLFSIEIPAGLSGCLTARAGNLELLGSGLHWPPEFGLSGWVVAENRVLVGKALMEWCPRASLTLAIAPCDGGPSHQVAIPYIGEADGTPFSIPLDFGSASRVGVSVVLPGGMHEPLTGSPVTIVPVLATPVGVRPKRTVNVSRRHVASITDIVIPVYAGREETTHCIARVLAITSRSAAEVVVVNDASPNTELCDVLAQLAADGRITLLTNRSNLGFPASANRGMRLHPDRDVVLLNSDAEPFGDWLERLRAAAYSQDDVGTVTPLGEEASITSYRAMGERSHPKVQAERVDAIARQVNARMIVDLPVGVGFCLYVKRECLADIGEFDENTFGKGYGEENDFCLRARARGWRHVAATDLFVHHAGARSFGRARNVLMERNSHVLNALHPGYDAMIADFVAADPLLKARRAIDMHRLLEEAIDPVLLVTFDLPGGVKRHVGERTSELDAQGHTVLILQPSGKADRPAQSVLRIHRSGMENLAFNLPEDLPVLRDLLLQLRLCSIEIHHFVGLPSAVLELVADLGIPYDVYVHDYAWICPRVTLIGGNTIGGNTIGGNNAYCGEPAIEECESCIRKHGTALEDSLTVQALRSRSEWILKRAHTVVVPTNDVRTRLARYFPHVGVKVVPWEAPVVPRPRPAPAPAAGRVRVGVIGGISVPKGYEVLLQCAQDAADRDLDLQFVVIGFTNDDEALLATGRVFVTGPYADHEVSRLLEREQCDAAFFPSIAPETWCYALSHALAAGLPIVAFDLGAIAERLGNYGSAALLAPSSSAALANDALLRSARKHTVSRPRKESAMDAVQEAASPPVSAELSASVQSLTLPVGIYTCTLRDGGTAGPIDEASLSGLQLGLAPTKSAGAVEFWERDGTTDRWLIRPSDMIVVKIVNDAASLMLTSVRSSNGAPLSIDIKRLGPGSYPVADAPPASTDPKSVPAQILAHIQNLGDVPFTDGLAGCMAGRLWIEAFAVGPVGDLGPDAVEYCGVTADGLQTPWLGNQMLCGSRGQGTPMMGFAIRLKPEFAQQYDCLYTGKFVSGSRVGPLSNGDLCFSEVARDPIWGIDLQVRVK